MLSRVLNVDPVQPLDLTHSLLRGMLGLWLPISGTSGGSIVQDIGPFRDSVSLADTSNVSWTTVPGWNTSSVRITNTVSEETESKSSKTYNADNPITVWAYITVHSLSGEMDFVRHGGLSIEDKNELRFVYWNGSNLVGLFTSQSTPIGEKVFLAVTKDGGFFQSYINGKPLASNTKSSSVAFPSGHVIGSGFTDRNPDMTYHTSGAYDRVLSESEIYQLYTQTRRGFPNLLNTRPRIFGLAGTGGGGAVALNASFSGAQGSLGTDVAVRVALENTLSGASGTLNATTAALPSITSDLQGSKGTLASGLASIAAVEASMTGNAGALTSQAAVLAALNAGLSGRPGTLNLQLSTSDLSTINASLPGAKGSLASQLAAQVALESALFGSPGTLNGQLTVPLSLDASFTGAQGTASIEIRNAQGIVATLSGTQGTMSATLKALQRLQAQLQGAAGTAPVVTEVTAAINASMNGEPGELAALIGDIGRLAEIDAQLRDILAIEGRLKDIFTINADLTD